MSYILASASPRRQELLCKVMTDFDVIPADIDETPLDNEVPIDYVERMAREKAKVIFCKNKDAIVIGCDTSVVYEKNILGKPKDASEAFKTLKQLSGKMHHVITSIAIISNNQLEQHTEIVEVTFYDLLESQINSYIASGEPMDKAGAYGIQDQGSLFVKQINGDYYSVVGLPIGWLNDWLLKGHSKQIS
ncbi:Maf family protein [Vagococcus vulneris]|uniref:dTTP/UTP pyrophosphatase n=1 Tax=Vagococcus vulneris TaxID=1977869 RepID=A0A429ZY68_9ENTE|nr:nucleoside triphosphate pyrophosphatase [Vagococcus vulneris]RST98894.1 hypothetical protein CBF37_05855 [Vagococcus vulneris]